MWVRFYWLIGVSEIWKWNYPRKYYGIYCTGLGKVVVFLLWYMFICGVINWTSYNSYLSICSINTAVLAHKLIKRTYYGGFVLWKSTRPLRLEYTNLYEFTHHHCPLFPDNFPVSPFNAWQKYFYRLRAKFFWDGHRWGLISSIFRIRCLCIYVL